MAEKRKHDADVVLRGGIAQEGAETENVTRDTYGFDEAEPVSPDPAERLAEANRAAEEQGIPGITMPETSE